MEDFLAISRALFISIFWLIISNFAVDSSNNMNLQPKQLIKADNIGRYFRGNHSQSDHFKLLVRDGNSLLVGARNAVYNLSMETLAVQKALEWPSTPSDVELCVMKGKSAEDCHNYVRVLVKQKDGNVLVCGTNSFKPLCRQYFVSEEGSYQVQKEFSGYAVSPYDARHNSTAFYLAETDELYTASVSDFAAADSLIYRKPLSGISSELRTPRNDLKCLNDPNFVSSFDDDNHVYFWFRETAAEFTDHGKAVYGRVARICKNDQGTARTNWDTWTSFVKARLNCSLPGNIPFYFNELQSTSKVIFGHYGGVEASMVYAVFSTPYNGIQASAICAFRLEDVRHIFNHGAFKHQPDPTSMWMPIMKSTSPHSRPGSCSGNSKSLGDDVVNFIQKNSLMYDSVPNFFTQPLFVDSNFKSHLTQIAVHQARAVGGAIYNVIFVGTDDGRVLKLINTLEGRDVSTVLVESVHVFIRASVQNLLIYEPENAARRDQDANSFFQAEPLESSRLVVVSQDEVKSLPLHYCSNKTTCSGCVRLQDPYCAWDVATSVCIGRTNGHWPHDKDFVQSVRTGRSSDCPSGEFEPELYAVNELYSPSSMIETPPIYSAQSMAVAVVVTLSICSTIGFLLGYRLARYNTFERLSHVHRDYESNSSTYAKSHSTNHLDVYNHHLTSSKLNDNLLLSLPQANNCNKNDKNLLTLNNGTLPKDYKVKKVYL